MPRERPSGTGSIMYSDGVWIARVNLADRRKVVRKRRTREDAEAALAELILQHADELGYHYRLALDGKPPARTPGAYAKRSVTLRRRWEVFERDGHRCRYCGGAAPEVRLVVDHIVPVAEGGSNDLENLVTACFECNAGKGHLRLRSVS